MGSPTLRLARLALYCAWTAGLMPVQLAGLVLRRRWTSTLPVFYHRWCCRILGFRIQVIGTPTSERPVLYAANHISYTDITVLGSVIPGSFIAKSELARQVTAQCFCRPPSAQHRCPAGRDRQAIS